MKQLKVSLPQDLRVRIEGYASAAGHSLGEEIRLRLIMSERIEKLEAELDTAKEALSIFVSDAIDPHGRFRIGVSSVVRMKITKEEIA